MTTPGDSATAWRTGGGSGTSLRPFTTTAEVPAVPGDPRRSSTGPVPPVRRRRRSAPLGLRLAVWTTAVLVVAGLCAIGLHREFPSWWRTTPGTAAAPGPAGTGTSAPGASPGAGTAGPTVTLSQTGATGATATVDTDQYTLTVSAQALCWVEVTTPGSAKPVFDADMQAGAQQTFHPSNGQLTLSMGASKVSVALFVDGKHTPAWQWTPTAAPYQLSFTSASG